MGIWTYADQAPPIKELISRGGACHFCQADMETLRREHADFVNDGFAAAEIDACPRCGWWRAWMHETKRMYRGMGYTVTSETQGAMGSLMQLDVFGQEAPIQAIRDHLMIDRTRLKEVHHDRLEKVVADVYRDLGFAARAVGRTGDGGIDVILEGKGTRIGIQVKQYHRKIQVNQIRELAGALLAQDITEGIFVTTSSFTAGAPKVVEQYRQRQYDIELIDGDRFLSELEVAQRAKYRSREDFDAGAILKHLVRLDFSSDFEPLDRPGSGFD